jgi:hypothetical protein
MDDFKILMGQADVKLNPENLDRLANACLVVDALGAKVSYRVKDFSGHICHLELQILIIVDLSMCK